ASFTIAAWINPDSVITCPQTIVGQGFHQQNYFGVGSWGTYNKLTYAMADTDKYSTATLSAGTWQHVCVTVDGTSHIVKFYIDGVFDSSHSVNDAYTASNNLFIGYQNRVDYDYDFEGSIRGVLISSVVLDEHEINQLYSNGVTNIIYSIPLSSDPIASWNLTSEVTNPIDNVDHWLYDISANGVQHNTDDVNVSFDREENCYYFDGDDDYITIPYHIDLKPTQALTLSAWVKLESFPQEWNMILSSPQSATSHVAPYFDYAMFVKNNGALFGRIDGEYCGGHGTAVTLGEWHHLAIVWDGETTLVDHYVDGVNVGTFDGTRTSIVYDNETPVIIGTNIVQGDDTDGYIASVQIFDLALSYEEILTLYGINSILQGGASTTVEDLSDEMDQWTVNMDIEIPDGVEGEILEFAVSGTNYYIEAVDQGEGQIQLKATVGGHDILIEEFESGTNYHNANGWSNIENPTGSVFIQDDYRYQSPSNSGYHAGGSGTTIYRHDEWTDAGTHTDCTVSGWVYNNHNEYSRAIIFPVYTSVSDYVYLRFYRDYVRLCSNIGGTGETSTDTTIVNWNDKWWQFEITVNTNQVTGWVKTGTTQYTLNTHTWIGTLQSGTVALNSRIGDMGGYWYDDLELTVSSGGSGRTDLGILGIFDYSGQSSLNLSHPLTDKAGPSVEDQSIYGNDGTVHGASLTQSMGVDFDGTDDYIEVPDNETLDLTEDFTFSAWIYPTGWGESSWGRILDKYEISGSRNNGYEIYLDGNTGGEYIKFWAKSGGSTKKAVRSDNYTIGLNTWQHVAFTSSSSALIAYVNGADVTASSPTNTGACGTNSSPLYVGNWNKDGDAWNRTFDGYIRNVQIWDRVLTDTEIRTMASSFIPTSDPIDGTFPITLTTTEDQNLLINVVGTESVISDVHGVLESVKVSNHASKAVYTSIGVSDHDSHYNSNTSLSYQDITLFNDGATDVVLAGNSVSGKLDDAGDFLGFRLPLGASFSGGTSGYYKITMKPSVEFGYSTSWPPAAKLGVKLQSSGVLVHQYQIKDVVQNPAGANGSGEIGNNQWTELVFSSLGYTTDQNIIIYITANTPDIGTVFLEVGDIVTLNKSSFFEDLDELLPSDHTSRVTNMDQLVYHVNGKYVLEDRDRYSEGDDDAYIQIPIQNELISNNSRLSFTWRVDQDTQADVGAGLVLECSDTVADVYSYFYTYSPYPPTYYTPTLGNVGSLGGGEAAAQNYFNTGGPELHGTRVYWYFWNTYQQKYEVRRSYGYFEKNIWVSLNGVSTLPSFGGIEAEYILESGKESEKWHSFDMTMGEILGHCDPVLTLSDIGGLLRGIYLVIDQHGETCAYSLTIDDVHLVHPSTAALSYVNRRVGNVQNEAFYVKEWLASPMYKLYDPKLPKTNIVPDGSFEEEKWLFTADAYEWGFLDPANSYYDTIYPHSGEQSFNFYQGEELIGPLELFSSGNSNFVVDFWVRGTVSSLKFGIMHSATSWTNGYPTNGTYTYSTLNLGILTEWTHVQEEMNVNWSDSLFYIWFINEGSASVNIDDIQLKPTLPYTTEYDPTDSQTLRSFDPENLTGLSFQDGWYELSLNGSSTNYVSVYDETSTFSATWKPAVHTQYFYAEILTNLDGTAQTEDWRITIDDPNPVGLEYAGLIMLWINGVLQGVKSDGGGDGSGVASFSDVRFQNGVNTILFSRTVKLSRPVDEENSFSFRLDQVDQTWHENELVSPLMPRSDIFRTPLIYYDPNQTTKYITRNSDENLLLRASLEHSNSAGMDDFMPDTSWNEHHGDAYTSWDPDGLLDFDGSNDYVTFGDLNELDTAGYFTVSLWFKRYSDENDATNHGTENVLLAQSSDASNDNLEIGTDGSSIDIYIDSENGLDGSKRPNVGISNNTWYHLVITYDMDATNEVKLYLNGELNSEWSDWSGPLDGSGSSPLSAGVARPVDRNWGDFHGIIRDINIWTRCLTALEVQELTLGKYRNDFPEDNPKYLANEVMGSFAGMGIPATIGGTNRLINYIDSDLEMTKGSSNNYTTWHPFGAVVMSHDTFPVEIFDGDDGSPIEKFLEAGGKLTTAPGYVPFSYYSRYAQGVTEVTGPETYGYIGAYGHQLIFDIDDDNHVNGTPEERDDFEYGLFFEDQLDDDYGATVDLPDNSGTYTEGTGPATGSGINNVSRYNYEPFVVANPAFSQLPHTGYSYHMALSRAEYDTVRDNHGATYYHSVYNGDGKSGNYSAEEANSGLGGYYIGYYTLDLTTSPLDAGLWVKPFLYDEYGVFQYSHDSPYYEFDVWSDDDAKFTHHERAIPGVGSVQGGKNAKGIVNVSPMFNWNDRLSGLDDDPTKDYHQGKFADRGHGSLTNSPTTDLVARGHLANCLGEIMATMTLDSIIVNACRDNDTTGTNFLNFTADTRVADAALESANQPGAPITYAWEVYSDFNGLLSVMGEYPVYGGDPGRGIANSDASYWDLDPGDMSKKLNAWSRMTYGLEEGLTIDFTEFLGKRDGLMTLTNIDKEIDEVGDIGENAPTALVIEGMLGDGWSDAYSELAVSITPFKKDNGAGMVY
ncbi:MAG: LamG domain-containing protein, partial [Promethearchaeota archaeon]